MRILVLGAGVIGSVYAGKLLQAGHEVVLLARGPRLVDLQTHGLILEDAQSGDRSVLPVPSVSEAAGGRFDLVLVPVRAEQFVSTLPVLTEMTDGSDVLFFGNTASRQAELTAALGDRAVFGFPAAGGSLAGPVVRYVLISQQKTMLGEPDGSEQPAGSAPPQRPHRCGVSHPHQCPHRGLADGARRVRRADRVRPLPGRGRPGQARRPLSCSTVRRRSAGPERTCLSERRSAGRRAMVGTLSLANDLLRNPRRRGPYRAHARPRTARAEHELAPDDDWPGRPGSDS